MELETFRNTCIFRKDEIDSKLRSLLSAGNCFQDAWDQTCGYCTKPKKVKASAESTDAGVDGASLAACAANLSEEHLQDTPLDIDEYESGTLDSSEEGLIGVPIAGTLAATMVAHSAGGR